jgi:uncharacterized protein (TIGR02231 family)
MKRALYGLFYCHYLMKKLLIILLLVSVFGFISSKAEVEKKLKAEVKSATVFLNGAQVNSEVRTEIEGGNTKFIISGIPGNLKPDEIQVKGKGEAIIVSTHYNPFSPNNPKSKEYHLLEDSLEHLQFEYDSLRQMEEVLKAEEQFIVGNKDIRSEEKGVKAHDLEDIADVYRERIVAIRGIILRNKIKQQKLEQKVMKIRIKKENYSFSHGEMIVTLNAPSKSAIVLEISYLTKNASWRPSYDLKGKNITEPLSLVYKADVEQHTNIPWENIKLSISTSSPTALAKKTKLEMWSVGNINYKKESTLLMEETVAVGYAATSKSDRSPKNSELSINTMENNIVSKENYSVEYEIQTPYSIPSDGNAQTLTIKTEKINPFYSHFIAPKKDKDALVLANITDWENLNLLKANANIFFEDVAAGSVLIDPSQTTDTLQIPVKKDKKVVVTREKIKDFTGKKFIGLFIRQEYGYLITVKNTNKEALNLTVQDQIPVSNDSQVEVEYINDSNAKLDSQTGVLSWDLHLEPTESKKIIFKFAVKYPKDKIIHGL